MNFMFVSYSVLSEKCLDQLSVTVFFNLLFDLRDIFSNSFIYQNLSLSNNKRFLTKSQFFRKCQLQCFVRNGQSLKVNFVNKTMKTGYFYEILQTIFFKLSVLIFYKILVLSKTRI